jgi:hypothetical protein
MFFLKWAKHRNRHFSKEDIDGQQVHKKMFNITNHQIKTELLPHTQNDSYQKDETSVEEDVKKRKLNTLTVGGNIN